MSADYKIENPYDLVKIDIICYHCGKSIDGNNPTKGHEDCINFDIHNRLKFNIDYYFKEDINVK